ncbi:histidine ammonia-lyase-like [Salvelinus namaycush]|uniref:Histidine ammonia-lyase-like n=1 Tax=Salvelinus namaycush TaxID=8040 RepID=A0A8U1BYG1_SALNM|nr:histidine ammonia-lyase-like [Salvelinus namaycush]
MAGESPFTIQWLGYEALKRYTKNMPGNRGMKAVKDIRFLARRCKARGCWTVMTPPIKYVLEDKDFIKIGSYRRIWCDHTLQCPACPSSLRRGKLVPVEICPPSLI